MAKDPAFLFYTQDFIMGTLFFSNEQIGIYIRLLCAQHQQGGIIDRTAFEAMVGSHEIIKSKFIEVDGGFFNERLMKEMELRNKKSINLSANAKLRWEKYKQLKSKSNAIASNRHMPSEDENEDENKDVSNNKKEYYLGIFNQFLPPELQNDWCNYLDYCYERQDIKLNRNTVTEQVKFLREHQTDAKKIMRESIKNNWKGLFEVKDGSGTKTKSDSFSRGRFAKGSTSISDINAGLAKAFGENPN